MELYYPKKLTPQPICKLSPDGRHRFTVPSINCDWCLTGGVIAGGEVLYVPTEKGIEYHQRPEPNVLLYGGRGSAKSTTGRWDAHMQALAHPNFTYIVLRRTFPELQKSHLIHVPREMKLLGGSFNYTDKIARYSNGSRGFFSHCANEEDVLNLLSAEFALAFFDELSTFEWEMFTKLAASVRVTDPDLIAKVRAATNPLGPSAQKVMEYFVDHTVDAEEDPDYNPNDWYAIKANLADNPYLDREQYKKRFSGLPDHVRKAWVDGEFVLENQLFNLQPTKQGKPYHVIHDVDLPKLIKSSVIYRTIDAGWFPDPTVVLWIAHLGNRHIVFHERTLYRHTAAETAEIIKEDDKKLGVGTVAMTYCDPSMDLNTTADIKTIKEIYEVNGIPMECSINRREHFATAMHIALAEEAGPNTPRIQFYVGPHQTGCPLTVKTIPQMRFDQKQPQKMADHHNDHWVVATCYYLMSHSSDPRFAIATDTRLRPWMIPKQVNRHVLGNDQVRGR